MAVKLRKPVEIPHPNGADEASSQPIPLKPLAVSGICVTKAALIDALRVYVPALVDVEVVEDGERFLLVVAPPPNAAMGTGE